MPSLRPTLLAAALPLALGAADSPQFGQAWSRNPVSPERNLPAAFSPADGSGLVWTAALGTDAHATPVVAGGRVYQGTNNNRPRDPRHQGDRGVLLCLDARDGRLLWQLVVPKLDPDDPYKDWPNMGICSPPTVEGDRVYVVTNRGEVLCLDARGQADGNDGPFTGESAFQTPPGSEPIPVGPLDADILWRYDLVGEAGIYPHDSAHASILIHGPHLYLNTGTGVDHTHKVIRTPDAPSLVVLDKASGRLLARDGEDIAPRIFHATWSSPAWAVIDGRPRVLLAAGDGVVYGFDPLPFSASPDAPARLRASWKYDPDPDTPKTEVHRFVGDKVQSPSVMHGMPVVVGDTLYLAGGGDLWWGRRGAWVQAVDLTTARPRWTFPLPRHVMGTPAVADGLLYLADTARTFYCLDAATGAEVWRQEVEGEVWASPLVADEKVYLGTRRGEFWVFAHGRTKQVLHRENLGKPISATAVAAHQTLFVATMHQLYAARVHTALRTPPPP